MSINLPLEPHKEALLAALAQAKGLSPDDLVRELIDNILADAPAIPAENRQSRSLRGLLTKYGPAPSSQEIDENRGEMFANFPHTDF